MCSEGIKMKQISTVQGLSQMRGDEPEREAETDERNVGTLTTDHHHGDSHLHLFTHRYGAVAADMFTMKSMLKEQSL